MTFTNRDQGDSHNRVLAGDFRYVWGLYYTQFQYGASFTSDAAGSRTAPIWQAEYDRTGRSWGFNYLLKGLGEGFDDQAGFVNRLRSGVVNGHIFNRFTLYGARGARWRTSRSSSAPIAPGCTTSSASSRASRATSSSTPRSSSAAAGS